MAVIEVRAKEVTCNGCGQSTLFRSDDEILGFHGKAVSYIFPTGGWGCKSWYACSHDCIKEAVVNAVAGESTSA